jgi:hypothetical protein
MNSRLFVRLLPEGPEIGDVPKMENLMVSVARM